MAALLSLAALALSFPAGAQEIKSCSDADSKRAVETCTALLGERGIGEEQIAWTLIQRAEAYADLRDCRRAIVDLTSALEIQPASQAALRLRGQCRVRTGDFDGAIADLTVAIAADPSLRYAYSWRAMAWAAKGEALATIVDMSAAIDQAGRITGVGADDLYYNALGHYWRHDPASAVRVLDEALAREPKHAASLALRGDMRLRLGEHARAIEDYSAAIVLQPDDVGAYVGRGEAKSGLGDREGMRADLEKVLALLAGVEEAMELNSRAWALHLLGRNAEALADAELSLSRMPNDTAALHTRGRIREALGQRDDAVADYRQGLRFDPGHPETLAEMRRLGEPTARPAR